MFDFIGKVAVVTGGARGIGRCIRDMFEKAGATVCVIDVLHNDFFVGEGADITIVAGCGIHNAGDEESRHDGIHAFHLAAGARLKSVEKHYGDGDGNGAGNDEVFSAHISPEAPWPCGGWCS